MGIEGILEGVFLLICVGGYGEGEATSKRKLLDSLTVERDDWVGTGSCSVVAHPEFPLVVLPEYPDHTLFIKAGPHSPSHMDLL